MSKRSKRNHGSDISSSHSGMIKLPGNPTLVWTPRVQIQKDRLCAQFSDQEWSGILYYTIEEGSLNDPDNMVLKAQYIYGRDLGSTSATDHEFFTNPKWAGWKAKNHAQLNCLAWRIGNIHSHYTLSLKSNFSSTDYKDLKERAEETLMYPSIIVTNDNEISGKLSITLESSNFTNENYPDLSINAKWKVQAYYDLNIQEPDYEELYGPDFMKVMKEDMKPSYSYNSNWQHSSSWDSKSNKRLSTPASRGVQNAYGRNSNFIQRFNHNQGDLFDNQMKKFEKVVDPIEDRIEDFLLEMLDDLFDGIETSNLTAAFTKCNFQYTAQNGFLTDNDRNELLLDMSMFFYAKSTEYDIEEKDVIKYVNSKSSIKSLPIWKEFLSKVFIVPAKTEKNGSK